MTRFFAAAFAALTLAAPAQATTVSVFNEDAPGLSFERQRDNVRGGGTFGVEFSNRGNNEWFRIGTATQNKKRFDEAGYDWSGAESFFRFTYGEGLSTISLSRNNDFRNAATASFEGLFFKNSNALIFEAKARPDLTLTRFDGQDLDLDIGDVRSDWSGWKKVVFVSEGIKDGFTLDGTINMTASGPSTINFDLGRASEYEVRNAYAPAPAPIPVPAALPLLMAGLGGLFLMRRFRRG